MSVNKYLPHVYVLPEDDANRQMTNGFLLDQSLASSRIRILEEAGGWSEVLDRFCSIYTTEMDHYPERLMVLLIDFDDHADRLDLAKSRVPQHLSNRVFIIGTLTEPEDLRRAVGSYESIGLALARDCREGTDSTWTHRLLRHNEGEVGRMRTQVRPILFPLL
jgi:hypothetical protein